MIQQINEKENPYFKFNLSFVRPFVRTITELGISKLLDKYGIHKEARTQTGERSSEKRTAFEIFQFLLLMFFQGCNLYRYLGSKKQDIACSKSTYHRFLSNSHYNWRRFIMLLAVKVTVFFDSLTCKERFRALVLDDSVIEPNRSKR